MKTASAGAVRAVLLDKDGTLTDFRATWEAWVGRAVFALAEETGTPFEDVAVAFGYDAATRRIMPDAVFVTSPDTVTAAHVGMRVGWPPDRVAQWLSGRTQNVPQVAVKGARVAIERIAAAGLPVGVLTNARRAEALQHLDALGLAPFLHRIIGCDCGFGAKPEPHGAADFADKLGLEPHEVVLVGDGLPDMKAARGAGLRAVGVLTGTQDAASLLAAGAETVLLDLSRLPAWLGINGAGPRAI